MYSYTTSMYVMSFTVQKKSGGMLTDLVEVVVVVRNSGVHLEEYERGKEVCTRGLIVARERGIDEVGMVKRLGDFVC